MNRLLLWDAVEQGIQGPNRKIAIIKLNTDLRKEILGLNEFSNLAEIKAKSKLAIKFLVEAAAAGCKYDYQDVVEGLQILKSLGYELKDITVYFGRGLPAVFTCDGEVGVVVAPEYWDSLGNLKTSVIEEVIVEHPKEEAEA